MKKFIIEESERERILNMHKTAVQKQYLSEQQNNPTQTEQPPIKLKTKLLTFKDTTDPTGKKISTTKYGLKLYDGDPVSSSFVIRFDFDCTKEQPMSFNGIFGQYRDSVYFINTYNKGELPGTADDKIMGTEAMTKFIERYPLEIYRNNPIFTNFCSTVKALPSTGTKNPEAFFKEIDSISLGGSHNLKFKYQV